MPALENTILSIEEIDRLGSACYDRLKANLEAEHLNRFVAIHVQSGDYTVDKSTARAMRAMRQMHANGQLFLRKIGNEPEYGLAARLLAGEMAAQADDAKARIARTMTIWR